MKNDGALIQVDPRTLLPYPANYNDHPPEQIGELARSLAEFGQPKNIVVWQGRIIAGHGLNEAAIEAGLSTIQARDVSHWPQEKAEAFLIADNETARMGRPDYGKLKALVEMARAQGQAVPGVTPERLAEIVAEARVVENGSAEEYDPGEVPDLLAPIPYFGGKGRVAAKVWERLGEVQNYVEPFCGSAAVLLACLFDIPVVTLNDADGFIANFWRAVAYAPADVAKWVDWPVNETDLFARHVWLVERRGELVQRLETDPDYYDAKIAGWWCWGACAWIGTGWCSGDGPWTVEAGEVVRLGNAPRELPGAGGRGVNRQLPHLVGDAGQGTCEAIAEHLRAYMQTLSDKLRRARVACGDWQRVTTPSVTTRHGLTAVLLDPPYGEGEQEYSVGGNRDKSLGTDVWKWAKENGNDPNLRIAVCGYEDGRELPPGWSLLRWKAPGGYGSTEAAVENSRREVIWFSPHCLEPRRL